RCRNLFMKKKKSLMVQAMNCVPRICKFELKSSVSDLNVPTATSQPVICEVCGTYFETRRGLSSHARLHLRQLGVTLSENSGAPIELLYQLVRERDGCLPYDAGAEQPENLTSDGPARSSAKRASEQSLSTASSIKRPKASDDCTCVLCGEVFENRKGLGSHARSHLRHIGVSDLVGKSSAIEAVQELVRSGMLQPVHPSKSKGAVSSSAASSPAPASPATPARSPAPSQSWTPHSPASLKTTPVKSPQLPVSKAPKAKKGFRLAVDPLYRKPKPEPVEMESVFMSLTLAGIQSPPTVLCDYCGQLFDTRKALSCHARAHLRQLGLTWSIKSSPIELLKEVMMHNEETKKELLHGGSAADRKSTPHASKPPPDGLSPGMSKSQTYRFPSVFPVPDSSCEVCGFYFENRKALASHARAHLRQLGIVEWRTDGVTSPIELLSELIRKDPAKVAQITRRYRTGDLYIKKVGFRSFSSMSSQSHRRSGSPSLSVDSDSVPGGGLKPHMQQQQHEQQHEHRASREDSGAAAGSSRQSQGHTRAMAAHGLASVRSPRGEGHWTNVYKHEKRNPHPHGGAARKENGDSNSQQAPRSGSIPALLPKPPLTPLVKLVGKIYSLKCRFCEEVFSGPLSVQEKWITHLQKHILSLGYKGNASPPATPVTTAALVDPVAV
uniref:Protein Wiz-like n=1 Tax=Salarias fasciatus TaxID=181472 RepID=A0A672JEH9_SALFA